MACKNSRSLLDQRRWSVHGSILVPIVTANNGVAAAAPAAQWIVRPLQSALSLSAGWLREKRYFELQDGVLHGTRSDDSQVLPKAKSNNYAK